MQEADGHAQDPRGGALDQFGCCRRCRSRRSQDTRQRLCVPPPPSPGPHVQRWHVDELT